jgi:hypothetical protein
MTEQAIPPDSRVKVGQPAVGEPPMEPRPEPIGIDFPKITRIPGEEDFLALAGRR